MSWLSSKLWTKEPTYIQLVTLIDAAWTRPQTVWVWRDNTSKLSVSWFHIRGSRFYRNEL